MRKIASVTTEPNGALHVVCDDGAGVRFPTAADFDEFQALVDADLPMDAERTALGLLVREARKADPSLRNLRTVLVGRPLALAAALR